MRFSLILFITTILFSFACNKEDAQLEQKIEIEILSPSNSLKYKSGEYIDFDIKIKSTIALKKYSLTAIMYRWPGGVYVSEIGELYGNEGRITHQFRYSTNTEKFFNIDVEVEDMNGNIKKVKSGFTVTGL